MAKIKTPKFDDRSFFKDNPTLGDPAIPAEALAPSIQHEEKLPLQGEGNPVGLVTLTATAASSFTVVNDAKDYADGLVRAVGTMTLLARNSEFTQSDRQTLDAPSVEVSAKLKHAETFQLYPAQKFEVLVNTRISATIEKGHEVLYRRAAN